MGWSAWGWEPAVVGVPFLLVLTVHSPSCCFPLKPWLKTNKEDGGHFFYNWMAIWSQSPQWLKTHPWDAWNMVKECFHVIFRNFLLILFSCWSLSELAGKFSILSDLLWPHTQSQEISSYTPPASFCEGLQHPSCGPKTTQKGPW